MNTHTCISLYASRCICVCVYIYIYKGYSERIKNEDLFKQEINK